MSFASIPTHRIVGVMAFCLAWPASIVADQDAHADQNNMQTQLDKDLHAQHIVEGNVKILCCR